MGSEKLYERILEAREGTPLLCAARRAAVSDGDDSPGDGLNKILKDLVVKSKTHGGALRAVCAGMGLPRAADRDAGGEGTGRQRERWRRRNFAGCAGQFATRYVDQHRRDFKRLGVFGRWDNPYLTMNLDYEATIAGAFLDFMEKGYVYRGRKPVYWCLFDQTALAEAEVEYEDHTSPSMWVTLRRWVKREAKLRRGHLAR